MACSDVMSSFDQTTNNPGEMGFLRVVPLTLKMERSSCSSCLDGDVVELVLPRSWSTGCCQAGLLPAGLLHLNTVSHGSWELWFALESATGGVGYRD